MKKLSLVVLVALFVAVLVVAGCGKKEPKAPTGAKQILDKSQQVTKDIKSVKGSGSADVLMPQSEEKETKVTFNMESNVISKDDVEVYMVATEQAGEETQVYLVGGYMYSYSPKTGWEKQKVQGAEDLTSAGLLSPSTVSDLSKYAQNVKQLPDEGNNYVISFDVSSQFFEKALSSAQGQQSSAPTSEEQKALQQMTDLMKDMLKGLNMNMVLKIDKTTYYPADAVVTLGIKGAPVIGDMTANLKTAFTDYNKPVTITLPPEARNAPEKASGLPSGIPSLPGLGL